MKDCLFCNIVKGKTKSYKLWEDSKFMSFLTPFPNTKGFTVVIPKKHYSSYIFDAPEAVVNTLMIATKKVAKILEEGLNVVRCAIVFEGYGIDHLHAKIIPLHGIYQKEWFRIKSGSTINTFFHKYHGYISSHDSYEWSDEQLQEVLDEIKNTKVISNPDLEKL